MAFFLVVLLYFRAAVPDPAPEPIRQKLEEVLSRKEFKARKSDSFNLFQFIARLLGNFFRWLGSLWDVSPALFWLLLSGCVLALFFLGVYFTWEIKGFFGAGSRGRRGAALAAAERRRMSVSYLEEARLHAARGDYTEAIRYLFLSLVYHFDEKGRVNFQKARTNREYLALLDQEPPVRRQLEVFVDALDEHWYGQRPSERREYEQCQSLYDQLARA